MTEIKGLLFDGKNVEKISLSLFVDGEGLAYLSHKPQSTFKFLKLAVSPRIGDTTRFITLPDGTLFETLDNDNVDKLCSFFETTKHSRIHSERWALKLGVMAAFLLLSWLGIHFGVPALTYKIAMQVPEATLIESGQAALLKLDEKKFTKSKLSKKRQKQIDKIFQKLLPGNYKLAYKLHFRQAGKIGANAFALPSGDIIITDELINLSSNDNEIISILLHEIAHAELRHAIQRTIQTSTILLLVVAVTGDVTSLSTLLLGIPALLLDTNYNRQMEWDADTYSLNRMQELKINPLAFANMLEKIVKSHETKNLKLNKAETVDNKKEAQKNEVGKKEEVSHTDNSDGYWSSHPPSKERINRMKEAGKIFVSKMTKNISQKTEK